MEVVDLEIPFLEEVFVGFFFLLIGVIDIEKEQVSVHRYMANLQNEHLHGSKKQKTN